MGWLSTNSSFRLFRAVSTWVTFILVMFALLWLISLSPVVSAEEGGTPVITTGQLIAVVLVLMIAIFEYLGAEPFILREPLIIGTIAGLILGLPLNVTLTISALSELTYLGVFTIGGASAPDAPVATVVALIFAKILGYTTVTIEKLSALVALAVPIAVLSMYIEIALARAGCSIYSHWADRVINEGKIDLLYPIVTLGTLQWALSKAIPILAIGALGLSTQAVDTIRSFVNNPTVAWLMGALGVGGAVMPAVGLAYLLKLMSSKAVIPWFIIGFTLAAYFNLPILGITLVIVGLLLAIRFEEIKSILESMSAAGEGGIESEKRLLTTKDLISLWFKIAFTCQWGWNYERMQGTAYAAIIKSVEKKLRKSKEELIKWMKLHNEFFNTNMMFTPLIMGLDIALEERGADPDTIRTLKTSLMGPLAGLGDSFMFFTWRPIAFGIGSSLALAGSLLGPILAEILWAGVMISIFWGLLVLGYRYGERAVSIIRSGKVELLRTLVTFVAVGIIAALSVTYINIHTPITITAGEATPFKLQSAFDMILPKLLPLSFLLFAYWLYTKGLTIGKVVVIVFLVGFILGLIGFLAT